MSKVLIKWKGALKNIDKLKSHIRYIAFRSQEIENKGLFSKEHDNYNYKAFVDRIEKNPALKHSKSIKAHKFIFSLKQVDYDAYKRSGKDYKALIRATLNQYEKKHGVTLDWVANIHDVEGHPHCHVLIKGVSDTKDDKGRFKRIYFKKEDFQEMKNAFDKEFDKDTQYKWHEKVDFSKGFNELGKAFESISRSIDKEIQKEELKTQQLKTKQIHDKNKDNKDKGRDR